MFKIVGQRGCSYCEMALTTLKNRDLTYQYRMLNPQMKRYFKRMGWTTVPQIWHKGKHIGGFNELNKYLREIDNA